MDEAIFNQSGIEMSCLRAMYLSFMTLPPLLYEIFVFHLIKYYIPIFLNKIILIKNETHKDIILYLLELQSCSSPGHVPHLLLDFVQKTTLVQASLPTLS